MKAKGFGVTRARVKELRLAEPALTGAEIARRLNVSPASVYFHLRNMGLPSTSEASQRRIIKFDSKMFVRIREAATRDGVRINAWIARAVERYLEQQ